MFVSIIVVNCLCSFDVVVVVIVMVVVVVVVVDVAADVKAQRIIN